MARKSSRKLSPILESAMGQAYHDRFLYLFNESVGDLLRQNPEVEERCRILAAEIFEIMAASLRAMNGNGKSRRRPAFAPRASARKRR